MIYDWQAALITLGSLLVFTMLSKSLLFKVPSLESELNKNKVICPWFVTLTQQSVGTMLLNVVVIDMVYDFFCYITHRFLFHGQGYWRKIHAVHHQARDPNSIY